MACIRQLLLHTRHPMLQQVHLAAPGAQTLNSCIPHAVHSACCELQALLKPWACTWLRWRPTACCNLQSLLALDTFHTAGCAKQLQVC